MDRADLGPAPATGRTARPSTTELTAWRLFLQAHSHVLSRLETDLQDEHALPLAWYDVLVQLVEAPERRLRMTELAERVLLSRSGLTRLVDRLERGGLVERQACDSDARGLFAVLTAAGYARLRQASPTHLRGIHDYAVGRLDPTELRALSQLMARFLASGPVSPAG